MDLKSGFWQVRILEKSRQYTSFTVGSLGVYEFLRMLYGLCNAPTTFQRLMQNCLGELNLTYALVYLDDMIVYSKTKEDHLCRLQAVFERFHEHRLKLKPRGRSQQDEVQGRHSALGSNGSLLMAQNVLHHRARIGFRRL